MLALDPRVPVMALVNRAFMHRATRWLPKAPTGQLKAAGVTMALRFRAEFWGSRFPVRARADSGYGAVGRKH